MEEWIVFYWYINSVYPISEPVCGKDFISRIELEYWCHIKFTNGLMMAFKIPQEECTFSDFDYRDKYIPTDSLLEFMRKNVIELYEQYIAGKKQ